MSPLILLLGVWTRLSNDDDVWLADDWKCSITRRGFWEDRKVCFSSPLEVFWFVWVWFLATWKGVLGRGEPYVFITSKLARPSSRLGGGLASFSIMRSKQGGALCKVGSWRSRRKGRVRIGWLSLCQIFHWGTRQATARSSWVEGTAALSGGHPGSRWLGAIEECGSRSQWMEMRGQCMIFRIFQCNYFQTRIL